jgi:hypothetical protein
MEYNRSYIYILPILGESFLQFAKKNPWDLDQSILRNTYIRSDYAPEYTEHLFIEYREVDYLSATYKWLEMHDLFIDKFQHESEDDIWTYCFKVPLKNMDDYKYFTISKYSKLSDQYKRHILRFHNFSLDSVTSKILYKDESLYLEREEELNCDHIPRELEIGNLVSMIDETQQRILELKPTNKEQIIWD